MTLETVEAPSPLSVHRAAGPTETLVVSFSGVGTRPGAPPPPEFVGTLAGRYHALFIADASRSWLNGPGVADASLAIIRAEWERIGAHRLALIGDSMGATSAIHLGDVLGADAVFATSPQITADPAALPEERRWLRWRRQIETHRFHWIGSGDPLKPWRFVLHGGQDGELIHALRMPWRRRQIHMIFPGAGHNVSAVLKRRGALADLVVRAVNGRRMPFRRRAQSMGGVLAAHFDADGSIAHRLGVDRRAGEAQR